MRRTQFTFEAISSGAHIPFLQIHLGNIGTYCRLMDAMLTVVRYAEHKGSLADCEARKTTNMTQKLKYDSQYCHEISFGYYHVYVIKGIISVITVSSFLYSIQELRLLYGRFSSVGVAFENPTWL